MHKLLIVEDEKPIRELIRMSLSGEGYDCTCVGDGQAAADLVEGQDFDLILLDIMLPKVDGYELLDYIRTYGIPVIFLTALGATTDKVRGLRAGAEDYITKPFEIPELLARVETVLRRYHREEPLTLDGGICVDPAARTVTRDGEAVGLTAKEFDLLMLFARNPGRALYRSQIYRAVWGEDDLGDSRTVDLHVQRLRRKLGLEKRLVPVYKIGYRLEG